MESVRLLEVVLQASWQATIALVIVLAIRLVAGRVLSGHWLYVLWMLVIVRLLLPAALLPKTPAALPVVPAMPFSEYISSGAGIPQSTGHLETTSRQEKMPVTETDTIQKLPLITINWWTAASGVWLAGAVGLGLYFAVGLFCLTRKIRLGQRATPENVIQMWTACCARFSPRRSPRLISSSAVESPVLLGLIRTKLILPDRQFAELSPQDWEHIFLHELAHHQRRDTWTNVFQLTALCVHWFNPILWLCQRTIRADREVATDERALHLLGEERRTDYGETLLRVLSRARTPQRLPVAIGIVESGSGMKRRLQRILNFHQTRLIFTAVGISLLAGLTLVAFGQEARTTPTAKKPAQKADTYLENRKKELASMERLKADLLAAARKADAAKIRKLRADSALQNVYLEDQATSDIIGTILAEGKVASFTAILDELRRTPAGKDWQPTTAQLEGLLSDSRKDFIDALLTRKLNLDLLKEANARTTGTLKEWTNTRLTEVQRQRAYEEALAWASGTGNTAVMSKLLDAGVDINCVADDGFTPLTRAAALRQPDAVRLLLERGAEVDKPKFPGWDYTPLCLAQTLEIAKLLKDAGANVNAKLFGRNVHIITYSAMWAPTEIVKWYLDQGVDPNHVTDDKFQPTLLFHAGKPETAELIIKSGVEVDTPNAQGQSAVFFIAAYVENPAEIIKAILKNGANPNMRDNNGNTPLMFAPDAATIEALIAAGADVHAKNDNGDNVLIYHGSKAGPDRMETLIRLGVTLDAAQRSKLLMDAIRRRDLEQVKALLAQGANPDESTKNFQQYIDVTPMAQAVAFGEFDIADEMRKAGGKDVGLLSQAAAQGDVPRMLQLIHDGANVMETTNFGMTPLGFAVRQCNLEAVKVLLESGASPDTVDRYGWTPLSLAEFMNQRLQTQDGKSHSAVNGKSVEETAAFYMAALPLLEARADKMEHIDENGETALSLAAAAGNFMTFPNIKKRGANLNHQRPDGLTPLMIAIVTKPKNARTNMFTQEDPKTGEKRSFSMAGKFAEALLKSGADPSIRNREGKTALDLAREREDAEMVAILENPPKGE